MPKGSQYDKYWIELRDAERGPDGKKKLVMKCHPSWAARLEKALRKRKDEDYDFKCETSANPWFLKCRYDPDLGRLVATLERKWNLI